MKHLAGPSFWDCYQGLPAEIRNLADRCFSLLKINPQHPSLHLKKINIYWSVRVGRKYRALAVEVSEDLLWFWIGTHAEYDRIIS